jgi:dTDP-4-amino-4,6-dideoxygalactose transaminase
VLTNHASFADRVRLFRSHGITTDPRRHVRKGHAAWYQEMQLLGYNYRMTDLAAALGESQLRRLDRIVARRRSAAERYRVLLRDIPDLVLPAEERSYERSAWHLYPVRLARRIAGQREEVFTRLRDAGIGVQVHYIPVYRHPFYERLGYGGGPCPNAEAFAATEISIPLFASITQQQQRYIARTLREIVKSL